MSEALRDRFFALWRDPEAPDALRGPERRAATQRLLADLPGPDVPAAAEHEGLALSYFPTARFKQLRFIPADALDPAVRPLFARPSLDLPELAAAFVDPEACAYHNYENILGLDRLFTNLDLKSLRLAKPQTLAPGVLRLPVTLAPALAATLARLDALGLHAPPADPARGGRRFIFHSAALADLLTDALRKHLPARIRAGFVHVNPVFRCNRFDPGDAPFPAHLDSPYHDGARRHISKYTLLLYLTPGRGDGLLRFADGPSIDEIDAPTAFVFDQRLAHDGRPYADGRKLFLRSELIHEDRALTYHPAVASAFARACYLGGHSIFAPELAARASAAYDRAAAAHFTGAASPPAKPTTYLHKQFRGAHFLTDGHDYWFHRPAHDLRHCAAIAVLDLLNASLAGAPFRGLCRATTVQHDDPDRRWIGELLRRQPRPSEPVFAGLDKSALLPEPEEPVPYMERPASPDFERHPFPSDWDATRNPRVVELYARARRWARKRLDHAPIMALGKELFLDEARFLVGPDKIHVLSRRRLGPVHFAGASFYGDDDFVGVDVTLEALHPLVPPIAWRVDDDTLHLSCDLFRNGWMVDIHHDTVPVPRILDAEHVPPDASPWLRAAKLDEARLRAETPDDDP